ncbi:MAG TPA: hypothetical protein VHF69_13155 [Candidatus Synoicihabitans sp.]|nr:hypothetical protein [Candidatus Synoicihabitans sp.]
MITEAAAQAGAFPFPAGGKDAALVVGLAPGMYSAHVNAATGGPGVALIEVYEIGGGGQGAPRMLNLSARSPVGRGEDILIVGLYVSGDAPKRYLVRGIGPTLKTYDVPGVLENPRLSLYQGKDLVRQNDDWASGSDAGDIAAAAAQAGAFPLTAGSKDAAMLVYLAPGSYSAHVNGVNDTTGVALVEVYEVP